jgi:LPS-assembly protein
LWGQKIPPSTGAPGAPPVSTVPPTSSVGEQPITITADENSYIGQLATADGNAILSYKGDTIYADHLIMDRSTKVVTCTGNVRIFSAMRVYRGDVVTYNLDTKAMTSANYRSLDYPKMLEGKSVTTPEPNHYRLKDASFTTSNRENPSFHLEATTIEYRPGNQIVLKNVLLYIGDVPVLYFPIFVQSLIDPRPVYEFDIGNSGEFGAFMDNKYNFVINYRLRGTAEFDIREKRGYAATSCSRPTTRRITSTPRPIRWWRTRGRTAIPTIPTSMTACPTTTATASPTSSISSSVPISIPSPT